MKTLLLLFVLVSSVEALAGDKMIHVKPDPCLVQMEAAMRAMEFWSLLTIGPPINQITLDVVKPDKFGLNRLVIEPDELHKFTPWAIQHWYEVTEQGKAGQAIMLWEHAKHECWKQH